MEQMEKLYHRGKNFCFFYDTDSFKITTDSVLLTNFIHISSKDKLLVDFGTGLGTIPLLLSSNSSISMIGIEMNKQFVQLASKTVTFNNLEAQSKIIEMKIQNSVSFLGYHSVDVVVSNPPYFKVRSGSMLNHSINKMGARHEVNITFSELAQETSKVLKNHGRFFLIHRVERLSEILRILQNYHLIPKRLQFVYNTLSSDAELFLLEAVKDAKEGLKIEAPIILKEEI